MSFRIQNKTIANMGLGVISADGTYNPTSTIQQHRYRWMDKAQALKYIFNFCNFNKQVSGRQVFHMPPHHAGLDIDGNQFSTWSPNENFKR